MNYEMTFFVALLFMLLTPGVLLTLPPKGSKLVVAATHGLVFALVYHFTHKAVWRYTMSGFENHEGGKEKKGTSPFVNMGLKNM